VRIRQPCTPSIPGSRASLDTKARSTTSYLRLIISMMKARRAPTATARASCVIDHLGLTIAHKYTMATSHLATRLLSMGQRGIASQKRKAYCASRWRRRVLSSWEQRVSRLLTSLPGSPDTRRHRTLSLRSIINHQPTHIST
jgi:hypothetical protein